MSDQNITNVPAVIPGIPEVKMQPAMIPGESNVREQLETIRETVVAESNGHRREVADPVLKAKQLIVDNYNDHRNASRVPAMTVELVNVLWFSGNRWNFKAVLEFTVVKNLMYMVSWNARRGEGYIDIFEKNVGVKVTED